MHPAIAPAARGRPRGAVQRFGEGADTLAVDDVSMAGLDLGSRLERGPCTVKPRSDDARWRDIRVKTIYFAAPNPLFTAKLCSIFRYSR